MIAELYTNAEETTLNGAINNSVTSIVVTDGSTFPTNNFRIKIEDEIIFVTSRSTNTLTVIRGAEGTTGVSHADTLPVNHVITAGALDAFKANILAIMGFGRRPSTGNTYGDEFDNESFSGWTAVNSGSAPLFTVIEQDKQLSLLHPGGGAAGQFLSYMKDTGGSLSIGNRIEVCFSQFCLATGYPQFTLWMADGMTYNAGNQAGFAFSPHEDTFASRGATGYNSQSTFVSSGGGVDASLPTDINMHMSMEWRGSNTYHMEMSLDGIQWIRVFTSAAPLAFTPRYIGFGFTTWGGTTPASVAVRSFRTNF